MVGVIDLFIIFSLFILRYLFIRKSKLRRERKTYVQAHTHTPLPSSGSLPGRPQRIGLSQAKVKSLEFLLALEWQGAKHLGHLSVLVPGCLLAGGWVGSGAADAHTGFLCCQ